MKINCCWLYAISKYGYPPSLSDTYRVIQEMVDLGFKYIELEGIGERNLRELFQNRQRIKKLAQDIGIKIVNF
ncbi:sugar phosphate isomerase/epimerase, partial [Candidatus Aerophobetes bacterium]|nr:sugar phosphate isomerase/epimerase [Candidatus Aerophobetes bacterium]